METGASSNQHAIGATHTITPNGSPFVYRNVSDWPENVMVTGGTVTAIEFSRDGSNYVTTGILGGTLLLGPKDYIRVTYVVAPTMTGCPL